MPIGAGKYDNAATLVREATDAEAVIVIVVGGNKGDGFSMQVQATPEGLLALHTLPDTLETVAKQVRDARGTA